MLAVTQRKGGNMIYHKKPDGKIIQIETTEKNKADKIRAYNLDKQLAEQRGQDFGTIYNDADSLPDEDKVTLGLLTQKEYDEKQAERANAQIKAELQDIDIKSIRSIREWIAKQPDAPEFIKQYESEAENKRKNIK